MGRRRRTETIAGCGRWFRGWHAPGNARTFITLAPTIPGSSASPGVLSHLDVRLTASLFPSVQTVDAPDPNRTHRSHHPVHLPRARGVRTQVTSVPRHRHHAAFRRARARSCHTQLTLGACRPHWREVVLSSSCASERVRRSPQCGGSRDCQAPSQWRRDLPCWVNVTVHGVQQHCFHWARHILQCWAWPPCGLLHMVRMSFGRVIGRDRVNCA